MVFTLSLQFLTRSAVYFCFFCRRPKSASQSPRPSAAARRTENSNVSSSAAGEVRSRHDKERPAESRKLPRHASSSDIRKSSPSYSDVHRSKKSARAASPSRQRSLSGSPEFVSSKHKRSKLVLSPVVVVASKSHKRNGHRRHGHSRSKERHVHSGDDRRRWPPDSVN